MCPLYNFSYVLFILFFTTSFFCSTTFTQQMYEIPPINTESENIYHNFYIIHRLEYAINFFISNPHIYTLIRFENFFRKPIQHEHIKNCIQNIHKKKSFSPLFSLWRKFSSYRYTHDLLFQKEFIEIILLLYKSIISTKNSVKLEGFENYTELSEEEILEHIDQRVELLDHNNFNPLIQKPFYKKTKNIDSIKTISFRFYIIKRIEKALKTLQNSAITEEHLFVKKALSKSDTDELFFLESNVVVTHEKIKQCIESLCKEKSLAPLFKAWKDIIHYKYIQDDTYLKDLLMTVFVAYKNILTHKMAHHTEKTILNEMESIMEIYEKIEMLPLEDVLDAIDHTTEKMIMIQNIHNKNKNTSHALLIPASIAFCFASYLLYLGLTP